MEVLMKLDSGSTKLQHHRNLKSKTFHTTAQTSAMSVEKPSNSKCQRQIGSAPVRDDLQMYISNPFGSESLNNYPGLESLEQESSLSASDVQQYEYKEPDENFISIDDVKVKNFLISLVQKQKNEEEEKRLQRLQKNQNKKEVILAIIDLDDEDDPNETEISIPPINKEKPIEQIEVIESDDDDSTDENKNGITSLTDAHCENSTMDNKDDQVVILQSDDDTDDENDLENSEYIDENEDGVEVGWNDLEQTETERQTFECSVCCKKVLTSYNLRRHMMIHTGERPFGCDICHRRFREFSDLKKHRRRHSQDRNFKCMICQVNKPSAKDSTKCSNCYKNGPGVSPEKSHLPASLKSEKKQITTSKSLALTTVRIPEQPAILSVPLLQTQQQLDTQNILDKVEAIQRPVKNKIGVFTRKQFPCPLCNRPFGTKHNLKRHFMIHTGEKPFNCTTCRKPFREYSTLKKHMQTHKRDRWYRCGHCVEKFLDYMEYTKHKNKHTKVTRKTSLVCSSSTKSPKNPKLKLRCDSFDSNDSSSEDSLECCECGQKFTDIDLYTDHLKEHDPTMFVFECYICKKTFEERGKLIEHISRHEYIGEEQLEVEDEED